MLVAYLYNVRNEFVNLYKLAKEKSEPVVFVLGRNLYDILKSSRRVYTGRRTTIINKRNILVDKSLDIGIIGWHNLFRGDKTFITCLGRLKVNGYASIGKGTIMFIGRNAQFSLGTNTFITGRATITVQYGISIGNNCAISWKVKL